MGIRVLVTAVGGSGVGSQIVSALRMDESIIIIGTDINDENVNKKKLFCYYSVPKASDPKYQGLVDRIIDQEQIQVIVPGSIPEMSFFLINKTYFENKGVKICCNNIDTFNICRSKSGPSLLLSDEQLSIPKYTVIHSLKDCEEINYYPLVLKPDYDSSKSSDVELVFDKVELELLVRVFLHRGINPIAQEWITNGDEYSISVISNERKTVEGICTVRRRFNTALSIKKDYFYQGSKYYISSGITEGNVVYNDELNNQVIKIARCLQSTGPLNIQGVFKNGEFYLFDIHAAITSGCYVRALAGYNEPLYMVYKLLNMPLPSLNYKECTILRELGANIIS